MVAIRYSEGWVAETANKICAELNQIARSDASSSDAWTRMILARLARLGKETKRDERGAGIWVYASKTASETEPKGRIADGGEWLFDLCWLDYTGSDRGAQLRGVPLVAEIEWGNEGDIIDDFQKMVLARAKLRLMIFCAQKRDTVIELFKNLMIFADSFADRGASDRYLLCGYANDANKFIYRMPDGTVTP